MNSNLLIEYFGEGGPIMWPIALVFVFAMAVVLERVVWWCQLARRSRSARLEKVYGAIAAGDFEGALLLSDEPANPFLATIQQGLLNAHSSFLGAMQLRATAELEDAERLQWVLGTAVTLAPLLGLLGTITGIMRSFNFVGDEQLAATKVSGGIAEALIATACGLSIAIMALIPYNYFNRRLGHFRAALERAINHTELLVESAKHHGHDLEAFAKAQALSRGNGKTPVREVAHAG